MTALLQSFAFHLHQNMSRNIAMLSLNDSWHNWIVPATCMHASLANILTSVNPDAIPANTKAIAFYGSSKNCYVRQTMNYRDWVITSSSNCEGMDILEGEVASAKREAQAQL